MDNTLLDQTEGASLWDTDVLTEFGAALKRYKQKGNSESFDDFSIVQDFRSIAAKKARDSLDVGADESTFEDWDLEVKLWDLVEKLLRYRYSEKQTEISAKPFNSDIVFEQQMFLSDSTLYELWILIDWLQSNGPGVDRPSNISTTKWLNTQLANSIENFDSDAPIRLGKSIEPQDQEQDNVFYKYIFDLLVAGKFTDAASECESTNNWTLRMILAGVNNYLDPVIDKEVSDRMDETTQGIKKKALWRRTVYLLSKNDQLPKYERAIYGYLAGDLSPLEVSTSYESDLLIYFNHIMLNEMEEKLISSGRVPKSDLLTTFPKTNLTVQKVMNTLEATRPEESEHELRILMGSVINQRLPTILNAAVQKIDAIMTQETSSNAIMDESYLLRAVVHLSIFISIIDPQLIPVSTRSNLITTYVLILRLYGTYDLIPLYASFLPEDQIREVYSMFLVDLFESDARPKQLELSRAYNLPLENILKKTVELAFNTTEPFYRIKSGVSLLDKIQDEDMKLIRSVEWFIEAKMYSDAIHSSIALFRRFLLTGRAKAAQEFATRNSISSLLKNYDVESMGVMVDQEVSEHEREELMQYSSLVTAFNAIDQWQKKAESASTYAFMTTITSVTTTLKDTIATLFLELSETEYEKALIHDLRSLYIPFLIIQLHNIYVSGGSKSNAFFTDALELTNVVASESTKYYQLFQNCDRLKEYLRLVAQCSALAASEGL